MGTTELIRYRVTGENQPELWKFIRDVAGWRGAAVPERVELSPLPEVAASGGRLLLGLPCLFGLEGQELAEVVGHELICADARQPQRELAPVGGPPAAGAELCH